MEDLEFYKKALQLQCFLANRMAEVKAYGEHWGANFCYKEMKEAMDNYYTNDYVKEVFNIGNLTRERAEALRFRLFDKEQMPNLYLFPIWFVLLLPYGTKVVSIGGEEFEYSEDTNLDTRFGCVAFGINICELPTN